MSHAGTSDVKYRVEFSDNLAIIYMDDGENRYNIDSLTRLLEALDQVEENANVQALITVGVGKFYSNGLDLKWLGQQNEETMNIFFRLFYQLYKRVLTFPVPTIAAINGHSYAGGSIFALSHDFRVMRTKRGWFCLPEIQLRMLFPHALKVLLRHKIPAGKLTRDMIVFGKRYTSEELLPTGILDAVVDQEELLDFAKKLAVQTIGQNGFDRTTLQKMKESIYEEVVEALEVASLHDRSAMKQIPKL